MTIIPMTEADRHTFTNTLAAALGWTPCRWDHESNPEAPNYSYSVCSEPTEALIAPSLRRMPRLYLRFDGWRNEGRVTITGEGMQDASGKAFDLYWISEKEWPSITAAHAEGAAKIAAKIQRRLLPEYLRIHGLAWDKVEGEKRALADNRALAARIATALGVGATVDDRRESGSLVSVRLDGIEDDDATGPAPSVRVECAHGRVKLEVTGLDEIDLAPILALLGQMVRA